MSAFKFFTDFIRIKLNPDYVIVNKKKDSQSERLIADLISKPKGGIAFFGDSIIAEWKLAGFFDGTVYNMGIGGDCTARALLRFDRTVAPLLPRAVFIHVGINDLKYGYPAGKTAENIQKIIEKAHAISSVSLVVVDSAPPVNRKVDRRMPGLCTNKKIDRLNILIRKVCAAYPSGKVIYNDSSSLLKDENNDLRADWTRDGMHISEEAYAAIAHNPASLFRQYSVIS